MRDKYSKHGAEVFEAHQLMEMQLFSSIRQGDTNPVAHELLARHPFGAMTGERPEELCDVEGIGEVSARMLCVSRDTDLRLLCNMLSSEKMNSEFARKAFLWLWFRNKGEKCVGALLLSGNSAFVDCVLLAKGRLSRPESYSDALIYEMEKSGAKKVVLCHNHKDNTKTPSIDDIYLTVYLKSRLEAKGLSLEAHYIVTDTDVTECPCEL